MAQILQLFCCCFFQNSYHFESLPTKGKPVNKDCIIVCLHVTGMKHCNIVLIGFKEDILSWFFIIYCEIYWKQMRVKSFKGATCTYSKCYLILMCEYLAMKHKTEGCLWNSVISDSIKRFYAELKSNCYTPNR